MYSGIVKDHDIDERWQSITKEKRCNNQLTMDEGQRNDVRCGGGERNNAAGHPSDGDGDRRQALGGWWRRIRWRRKWDFAVDFDTRQGEYNFSGYSKLALKLDESAGVPLAFENSFSRKRQHYDGRVARSILVATVETGG